MPFRYDRTIRFQDTDAAGVVYFANILAICHDAYEASLAATGINLRSFFSNPTTAIPIVHTSADFFHPLFCGDELAIALTPKSISADTFEIAYEILAAATPSERPLAKAFTKHICIAPATRVRSPLPPEMVKWLQRWGE